MPAPAVPRLIERYFIPITIILSALAMWEPELFTWIKPHIALSLGIIMFGMGMTLEFSDFLDVARKWRLVGLGAILQYVVMPLGAYVISHALGLPREALIGMVVVGACPGGTASNVIAYLARANVPLSVTMTLTSTCLAPILTPAIVYFLLKEQVHVDFWAMVGTVSRIVLLPLVGGLLARRLFRRHMGPLHDWFPSVSITVIMLLIACIIGLSRDTLLAYPVLVAFAVALHNGIGLTAGYSISRLFGCSKVDARTLAIEVGMQNSGLGLALAMKHFGAASALPGALFSLWHNVTGVSLAKYWRRKED